MHRILPLCLMLALLPSARGDEAAQAEIPITITGKLKDTFYDPTDSLYVFLYVQATNRNYYVPLTRRRHPDTTEIESSIGAAITLTGSLFFPAARPFSTNELRVGSPKDITLVKSSVPSSAKLPDETRLLHLSPEVISMLDEHCVRGKVLAAWDGTRVVIRTLHGNLVEAELKAPPLPRYGETIDVTGLPETTLYTLRLNRATWQRVSTEAEPDEPVELISARQINTDESGRSAMNRNFHGRPVRIRGIVRSLPREESGDSILYLDDQSYIVPVHTEAAAGALKDIQINSTLEVVGTCVMNIDPWRPNAIFPRIRGYTLITRKPGDLKVIATPPWLTPAKALALVASLFAVIVGILAWNWALRTKSEKRGRLLAKEQILHAEADLKVHERTRLAVELHDALSQNLAGVALELQTVTALAPNDLPLAVEHLRIADRSLLSCREELRNCLYDLRSDALEAKDMDTAIRMTLGPQISGVDVSVRFNVPRARLSENTAHAILCIVRELTLNALRHGHATHIRIAGALDGRSLRFSVQDNGCGFDPDNHPGVRQGHFGLQGIRERVSSHRGNLTIISSPGSGSKVTVTLGHVMEDGIG